MSLLRTVVTYDQPAQAEVDKAFLEAEGITVNLLNYQTARNELGAPFYIQLQVPDQEHARAVELLKAVNPSRFGSEERVAALERGMKRTILRFLAGAGVGALMAFLPTAAMEHVESGMATLAIGAAALTGGVVTVWILGRAERTAED